MPGIIYLQSLQGVKVNINSKQNNNCIIISKENLAKGLYFISSDNQSKTIPQKIVIE